MCVLILIIENYLLVLNSQYILSLLRLPLNGL